MLQLYEELKGYIRDVQSNHSLRMESLEQFKPKTWIAEKNGKLTWKMGDLPTLEVTQTELDEIMEIVPHKSEETRHNVYSDTYFQTGPYVHICSSHTPKYDYYFLYMGHTYVVPIFIRTIDVSDRKLCLHPAVNNTIGAGSKAIHQINEDLRTSQTINETDTLTTTLVPGSKGKWKHLLKLCVPNQIGWYDISIRGRALSHCYKADVSSAFPFQLTKKIPTLKGCKIKYDTKLEPNEEYPFVFTYPIGQPYGRVEIFNELDTDVDINSPYMKQVATQIKHSQTRLAYLSGTYEDRKIELNPMYYGKRAEEFICIACKEAPISLADVMQVHYDIKNSATDEETKNYEKLVMNALIGYMQKNGNGTLPFISAVVIARQNHRMIEICNSLSENGNRVLYIATDSIVWRFANEDVATKDKYLGSFTMEYEDCDAYIMQVGAYQIRSNNKTKTWCSYLPNDENKSSMEFGTLPAPKNETILYM